MRRIIIFTRYPEPGRTKTRLVDRLGEIGAAELQRRMTLYTMRVASQVCEVECRFTGSTPQKMRDTFHYNLHYRPQGCGDLGERMQRALGDALSEGCEEVLMIGSDAPQLTADILNEAFMKLAAADCVIGPAADGGYYLIGLRSMHAELFRGIKWGDSSVYKRTLEHCLKAGLRVARLKIMDDVDRPADLHLWQERRFMSVIIPALNEAENIKAAIEAARAEACEVLVVDGGSTDSTCQLALDSGARLIHAHRGRAQQLNAGAEASGGEILLFVHADSILPEDFASLVRHTLEFREWGAFSLQFRSSDRRFSLIAALANWRSRSLGLPYGDQGLFMRREIFERFGGFPDMPLMEDLELARRLKLCHRPVILKEAVQTSARRYRRLGPLLTSLRNVSLVICYLAGADPARLAGIYRP